MSRLSPIASLLPDSLRQHLNALYARYRPGSTHRLVRRLCAGQGIEIGPGKHPYGDRGRTEYLDKHTDNKDGTRSPDLVAEASAIPRADASYDYLIASHVLEHCQNTLKTLHEWLRVLRPGGTLFLILPHGDRTFDRHRAKTTLAHHIEDLAKLTDEPDRSHIEEIELGWSANENFALEKREYERQWGAAMWDWDFRFANDVIHFHVWTQDEIVEVVRYLGMKLVYVAETMPDRPDSFIVVARKAL